MERRVWRCGGSFWNVMGAEMVLVEVRDTKGGCDERFLLGCRDGRDGWRSVSCGEQNKSNTTTLVWCKEQGNPINSSSRETDCITR